MSRPQSNSLYISLEKTVSKYNNQYYSSIVYFCRSVEDRYKHICDVAKTRSILSLGISFFKKKKLMENGSQPRQETDAKPAEQCKMETVCFKVQTFNLWVLCMDNFVVEPASLKFLVEHGFDFNKQYAQGIPFTRGMEKVQVYFLCNCILPVRPLYLLPHSSE